MTTIDISIDLSIIPDLVRRDEQLLRLPESCSRAKAQADLIVEACYWLRSYYPELRRIPDDELYTHVAQAFTELNG